MNDSMHDPVEGGANESLPPPISPGVQLAALREQRGWTIDQVASQLNLAPRQVVAIESDDYASLPGMPIVRGFIRGYAKLLKIDFAPLLASLGGQVGSDTPVSPRKTISTPFPETRLPSMTDRAPVKSKWLAGALLIAVLGVGIWVVEQNGNLASMSKSVSSQIQQGMAYLPGLTSDPKSEVVKMAPAPIASNTTTQTTPITSPETAPAASGTEASAALNVPGSAQTGAASVPSSQPKVEVPPQTPLAGASVSGEQSKAAEITQVPATGQPLAAAQNATPSTSAVPGKDNLVLNARQDSWVDIRQTRNKTVLLSRMVKAGSTETVEVTEPVLVVVGNASGVDLTFRGAPIDTKVGRGNVARLTLK